MEHFPDLVKLLSLPKKTQADAAQILQLTTQSSFFTSLFERFGLVEEQDLINVNEY